MSGPRIDEVPSRQGLLTDVMREATASVVVRESIVALAQYRTNPLGFFVEQLGVVRESVDWALLPEYAHHAWDGTPNPLMAMLDGLAKWDDVGVEAGTGTQKSFTAAAIVLWFLACWENARVFTFAPKEDQLRLYIWSEMSKLMPRFRDLFPTAVLTDLCLRMRGGNDDTWAARGYSVGMRVGETISSKAAGMHAEHMLLIYEETQGVLMPVIEAGENTSTGPHNLRLFLGNPDHQFDTLHVACTSPGVKHVIISALDHPNVVTNREVVPGAVGAKSVMRRQLKYGEDDRRYRSRVRGLSPPEAAEALIKYAWIRRAQERWKIRQKMGTLTGNGKKALGVDVANSEGGDEAAIASFDGPVCLEVEAFPCPNANDLGMKVAVRMNEQLISDQHVGVDSVGVGAGCVNELKRRDHYIRALNGGATPEDTIDEESFLNLRGQIYWQARDDLQYDRVDVPPDEELALQLTTVQWEPKNGKVVVEQKEKIKARSPGGKSPNKADAFVYANFVRPREVVVAPRRVMRADTVRQRLMREIEELDAAAANADVAKYGTILRQ